MQIISGISTAFYFWLQPGQSFSSSWISCSISPSAADINQHTVLMFYFPILFLEQLVKQAPWQSVSQVIYHETVWPSVDHCLAMITLLTASHSVPIPHLPIAELSFSHQVMSNSFVTPWTAACQDSSVQNSSRVFQTRILEWVAIFCSRGSSWSRDWTHVSCISCTGKWVLYL